MVYYTSFATIPGVIGILLFAILANASMTSAQQGSVVTDKVPPLPTSKLNAVKIISPSKGQQVPIGKDLTISGITSTHSGNLTSHCQVAVIANGVKPYQQARATGPGGQTDYSKWSFILASNYASIKPGPNNKITARYVCNSNPGAVSFYSVNVTGGSPTTLQVPVSHTVSVNQTEQPVRNNNNSASGNSTSISSASMAQTSPASPSNKVTYLGESKFPASGKHTSPASPSNKLDHGHHHRGKSPSLQSTLTTGLRSIEQSGIGKSEFTPFIFPIGPR
jgi:hypothetical protein